ncbi:hypothetical protein HDU76_012987, partial [Blyttiomyces sp. JEL0837]
MIGRVELVDHPIDPSNQDEYLGDGTENDASGMFYEEDDLEEMLLVGNHHLNSNNNDGLSTDFQQGSIYMNGGSGHGEEIGGSGTIIGPHGESVDVDGGEKKNKGKGGGYTVDRRRATALLRYALEADLMDGIKRAPSTRTDLIAQRESLGLHSIVRSAIANSNTVGVSGEGLKEVHDVNAATVSTGSDQKESSSSENDGSNDQVSSSSIQQQQPHQDSVTSSSSLSSSTEEQPASEPVVEYASSVLSLEVSSDEDDDDEDDNNNTTEQQQQTPTPFTPQQQQQQQQQPQHPRRISFPPGPTTIVSPTTGTTILLHRRRGSSRPSFSRSSTSSPHNNSNGSNENGIVLPTRWSTLEQFKTENEDLVGRLERMAEKEGGGGLGLGLLSSTAAAVVGGVSGVGARRREFDGGDDGEGEGEGEFDNDDEDGKAAVVGGVDGSSLLATVPSAVADGVAVFSSSAGTESGAAGEDALVADSMVGLGVSKVALPDTEGDDSEGKKIVGPGGRAGGLDWRAMPPLSSHMAGLMSGDDDDQSSCLSASRQKSGHNWPLPPPRLRTSTDPSTTTIDESLAATNPVISPISRPQNSPMLRGANDASMLPSWMTKSSSNYDAATGGESDGSIMRISPTPSTTRPQPQPSSPSLHPITPAPLTPTLLSDPYRRLGGRLSQEQLQLHQFAVGGAYPNTHSQSHHHYSNRRPSADTLASAGSGSVVSAVSVDSSNSASDSGASEVSSQAALYRGLGLGLPQVRLSQPVRPSLRQGGKLD